MRDFKILADPIVDEIDIRAPRITRQPRLSVFARPQNGTA
jgi:hypothetical protein